MADIRDISGLLDSYQRVKPIRRRNGVARLTLAAVRRMVGDWLTVDNTAQQFTERANQLKIVLRDQILPTQGDEDADGHVWIDLDGEVVDPSGKGAVTAIQRQRRVSRKLNAERAEKYLKRRRLWDRCTETVTEINEDEVLAAAFEGKISEDDLAGLYDVTESFAFIPKRK